MANVIYRFDVEMTQREKEKRMKVKEHLYKNMPTSVPLL